MRFNISWNQDKSSAQVQSFTEDFVFVPQLLASTFAFLSNSMISARILSAFAVLATAIVIYKLESNDSSLVGSLLFLTSFYTIRFGMRFYLDPFGGLFVVVTVYSLYRNLGRSSGAFALVAALSRQLAVPLIPAFAYVAYRRRLMKPFVLDSLLVGVSAAVWILLARNSSSLALAAGREGATLLAIPTSLSDAAIAWIEFLAISPLIVTGYAFSTGKRSAVECLPIAFSVLTLFLTIGFIENGAATEYPYILNVLMCIPAGVGLHSLYLKILGKRKGFLVLVALLVVMQFAAQSYLATDLSPNHTIGVEDFGYNYDQELLAYLNAHYTGGAIYGSNRDGMLLPNIEPNWVWIPQNITLALRDNPPWLVTYVSYLNVESVPPGSTVVVIGPYLVVHSPVAPLSSFLVPVSVTGRFSLTLP